MDDEPFQGRLNNLTLHQKKNLWSYGCIITSLALVLTFVLVLASYHTVDFNQVALVKRRVTGVVEYNNMLNSGFHYLPLTKSTVGFAATQQRVAFLQSDNDALIVFSEQGLEFDFNIEFYYKLEPDGLGYMYRTYGSVYDDRINKISQACLKDQATNYTSNQFIRSREQIQRDFAVQLEQQLQSTMNITIDADLVVLLEIHFPDSLVAKNRESTIEIQNNTLQLNQQAVDIIKAQTASMVTSILAMANFTIANAEIQGNQTIAEATAVATMIQLNANADGLNMAIQALNLTPEETEALLAANALRKSSTARLLYGDFTPLISS